jgi:DNA mismatch endonuclease (patch repair protein)
MSMIGGKNTQPEVRFRKALWRYGIRYGLKGNLIGRPDLILRKYRTVIFVDGCFWHHCKRHFTPPRTNALFWEKKIQANAVRDRRVSSALRRQGWRVIRVWEHAIRKDAQVTALQVVRRLRN